MFIGHVQVRCLRCGDQDHHGRRPDPRRLWMPEERKSGTNDEKDIVDLLVYHLKQAGFSVSTALDGSAGLEKAKKERPSLVILDLMLPGVDGKDVCRALKSNPLHPPTPV